MLTSGPCSRSQALYENMLVELPFAGFFLSKLLGTSADVDIHHLASLDPEVYRNLLFLKSYEGDVEELGLNFTVVNNDLGEAQASGAGGPAPARVLLCAHADTPWERPGQVGPSHLGIPFCVHTWASCCGSLCTFQLETRRAEPELREPAEGRLSSPSCVRLGGTLPFCLVSAASGSVVLLGSSPYRVALSC